MDEDVPQCAALGRLKTGSTEVKKGAEGAPFFGLQRSYLVSIFCTLALARNAAM